MGGGLGLLKLLNWLNMLKCGGLGAPAPEQTKALVFIIAFVFVLAHENAMKTIRGQIISL